MSISYLRWAVLASIFAYPLSAQIGTTAPSASSDPAIRVTRRLVVIDAAVVDRKGEPVHGLGESDFTLLEDGKPQKIESVEEFTYSGESPEPPRQQLARNSFATEKYTRQGTPTVILLDLLNTPPIYQTIAKEETMRLLRQVPSGTPIAIFGLTDKLHLFQSFTADPAILRAAMADRSRGGKIWTLAHSSVNGIPNRDNLSSAASDSLLSTATTGVIPDAMTMLLPQLQQFEAWASAGQLMNRVTITLNSLNSLANYLGGIPGKKNLIWFSATFPFKTTIDSSLLSPFDAMVDASSPMRQTAMLMTKSRVAMYPVDPRGAAVSAAYEAANGGRDPAQRDFEDRQALGQSAMEHQTMQVLAEDTGGKAFFNTNDLNGTLRKIIGLGSNYYSISYSPSSQEWDGKYRKISILLERKGLHVASRKGYFASERSRPGPEVTGALVTRAINGAMLYGSPTSNQVPFDVSIELVVKNETEAAPRNQIASRISGPFSRYVVHYHAPADSLVFQKAENGTQRSTVKFLLLVYSEDGTLINSVNNVLQANLVESQAQAFMADGFHLKQEVSVPAAGRYVFRIGVSDTNSSKVGTIEVPLREVKPSE